MTNIVDGLLYSNDDEWVMVEGEEATIGITDYAQDALSDIVYVEFPEVGESFDAEETFGTVESVKAVADLNMPIGGEILAINEELEDAPESLNESPYASWIVRIKMGDLDELGALMDADAYRAYCAERS